MSQRIKYIRRIERGLKTTSIVLLIGSRQVGKTHLMKAYPYKGDKHFLNGQDPETADMFQKLSIIETYLKININESLNGLLLLDEFQFINGISTMLKLLTDKYPDLKIICSGSSSLDILQQVEESLAGRIRIVEVFSLSFEEFLEFEDKKLSDLYKVCTAETGHSALTAPLLEKMNEYLIYGGYPRMALQKDLDEKTAVLDDIYKTYLMKDIRNYIKNEHVVGFNKMLRILASQISNMLNVNELSRETGLPYKKCEEYLYLLEQMYIIKTIEPYYTNKRKVIGKMKKIYFADIGLRNIVLSDFSAIEYRTDNGALFENFVLLELLKNQKVATTINYYRTTDGAEVDFVINDMKQKTALECKYKKLEKPIGTRTLTIFSEQENIRQSLLVNQSFNGTNNEVRFIQGYLMNKVLNEI